MKQQAKNKSSLLLALAVVFALALTALAGIGLTNTQTAYAEQTIPEVSTNSTIDSENIIDKLSEYVEGDRTWGDKLTFKKSVRIVSSAGFMLGDGTGRMTITIPENVEVELVHTIQSVRGWYNGSGDGNDMTVKGPGKLTIRTAAGTNAVSSQKTEGEAKGGKLIVDGAEVRVYGGNSAKAVYTTGVVVKNGGVLKIESGSNDYAEALRMFSTNPSITLEGNATLEITRKSEGDAILTDAEAGIASIGGGAIYTYKAGADADSAVEVADFAATKGNRYVKITSVPNPNNPNGGGDNGNGGGTTGGDGNKELSGGAIAGIAIGCIAGALLIAYVLGFFLFYRKGKLTGKFFTAIYKPADALSGKKKSITTAQTKYAQGEDEPETEEVEPTVVDETDAETVESTDKEDKNGGEPTDR